MKYFLVAVGVVLLSLTAQAKEEQRPEKSESAVECTQAQPVLLFGEGVTLPSLAARRGRRAAEDDEFGGGDAFGVGEDLSGELGRREGGADTSPKIGLRLGFLIPIGASEEDWNAGFMLGGFYRRRTNPGKINMDMELGMDMAFSGTDNDMTGTLIAIRADILKHFANYEGREQKQPAAASGLYALFGGQMLIEMSKNDKSGDMEDAAYSFDINLGIGFRMIEKRFGVRLTGSYILGSENVPFALMLTGGTFF